MRAFPQQDGALGLLTVAVSWHVLTASLDVSRLSKRKPAHGLSLERDINALGTVLTVLCLEGYPRESSRLSDRVRTARSSRATKSAVRGRSHVGRRAPRRCHRHLQNRHWGAAESFLNAPTRRVNPRGRGQLWERGRQVGGAQAPSRRSGSGRQQVWQIGLNPQRKARPRSRNTEPK